MKVLFLAAMMMAVVPSTASAESLSCDGHPTRMEVVSVNKQADIASIKMAGFRVNEFAKELGLLAADSQRFVTLELELPGDQCFFSHDETPIGKCFWPQAAEVQVVAKDYWNDEVIAETTLDYFSLNFEKISRTYVSHSNNITIDRLEISSIARVAGEDQQSIYYEAPASLYQCSLAR